MSLSDLPDDILNLISIRLNGFDNCFLWMASDSKLKERLVNNVITDFDIKYTIPGRYLWPGNFLKKLKQLSRLSLVVDKDMFHIHIQNIELFPIPTLKYLKLDFSNLTLAQHRLNSSNPLGPTTSSGSKYINLNDLFCNLEYLEIPKNTLEVLYSIDFLGCLPRKLQTLLIPETYLSVNMSTSADLNATIESLPESLTRLNITFDYAPANRPCMDLSKLPPNLTNLTTNAHFDDKTFHMIPKNMKSLIIFMKSYNINNLAPFLPTGLLELSMTTDNSPTSHVFTHLQNLQSLSLHPSRLMSIVDLITNCPPKLKEFRCSNFDLTGLPVPSRLFSNHLITLVFNNIVGITTELISSLPQSVTELTLSQHSTDQKPFAFFSVLPRNLKSLDTHCSTTEKLSLLPESLTRFRLTPLKSDDASYFDRLPPKLKTLIARQNLPRLLMKELPASLTKLNIISNELIDDEIIRMLPRGLKRLSFDTPDNITDAGAADLPRYIERILLHRNTKMTDAAVVLLPRGLIELKMPQNPNFTDECVKHLPRNLTSLHLNRASNITSNSCKDLPKYLKVLNISECKDWDPKMLIASKNELPQYIKMVYLGNTQAVLCWRNIIKNK